MNKVQLAFMENEFRSLRQKTFLKAKKLATRREAKILSLDEKWEILLQALNQKILPIDNRNCWTDYGKSTFLTNFDWSSYEYPADIDKEFLKKEEAWIDETIQTAMQNLVMDEKNNNFNDVFDWVKATFKEHYDCLS